MKRLIVPSALRNGVPPVAGSSSIEPRFCAARASVCFLVQVIGLMAMAPGCTTGLGRGDRRRLGVPGGDDAGVAGAVRELEEAVLAQVGALDRIAGDVGDDHALVHRRVRLHVLGEQVGEHGRALGVAGEDEGAAAVEVLEEVLEGREDVGRRGCRRCSSSAARRAARAGRWRRSAGSRARRCCRRCGTRWPDAGRPSARPAPSRGRRWWRRSARRGPASTRWDRRRRRRPSSASRTCPAGRASASATGSRRASPARRRPRRPARPLPREPRRSGPGSLLRATFLHPSRPPQARDRLARPPDERRETKAERCRLPRYRQRHARTKARSAATRCALLSPRCAPWGTLRRS